MESSQRPKLTTELSGQELLRWYWLHDELARFARAIGVRATGGKAVLTARLAAHLDGTTFSEPTRPPRISASQLSDPLTPETRIPRGQRCSQVVRRWMAEQVGRRFHFDGAMRDFFARADGSQTMQDALDHWHATRDTGDDTGRAAGDDTGEKDIGAQFEYNRFTRAWHRAHPDGSKQELLDAWKEYRGLPVDARERPE